MDSWGLDYIVYLKCSNNRILGFKKISISCTFCSIWIAPCPQERCCMSGLRGPPPSFLFKSPNLWMLLRPSNKHQDPVRTAFHLFGNFRGTQMMGKFPWTMKQECGSLIQAFAREWTSKGHWAGTKPSNYQWGKFFPNFCITKFFHETQQKK